MTADIWPLVHAERAALAADLADLTDEQWATPSLCTGLTVREVLAHLTAAANLNPVRWMVGVVRCRFDFDKQVAMRLAEQLGTTSTETLERFRSAVTSTTKPPLPVLAMLGESIVHGEDIRRALGIRRAYPIETVTRVAEYYRGSDLVVLAKGRIGGLRLVANDGPFTAGAGPLVSGSTLALTMAMTGRTAYFDELEGDGVPILRSRCGTDDREKNALSMFLQAQRASVLAIVDGLDAEALTTSVLPSGWTPLGLVEHLGYAERHWFQEVLTGSAEPVRWPDGDAPRTPSVVFEFYRAQCERSDALLAATPLSTPPRGEHPGELEDEVTDLRWIVLHMIEETARHAGHLDIARELLDGKTGLGPR